MNHLRPLLPLALATAVLGACVGGTREGDDRAEPSTRAAAPSAEVAVLRARLSAELDEDARRVPYREAWGVLTEGARVSPGAMRLFYTRRLVDPATRASGAVANEADFWNREHLWPRSYGIDGTVAESDLHNLVPADRTVNSSRGNKWFDEATTPHHECTVCRVSGEAFTPAPEVQGDVARALFYMDLRYEGEDADVPDLVLGERPDPAAARMGRLSTLLAWHCADPVSAEERRRHEAAARAQGNRNVFVDEPALAEAVYGVGCPAR